MKRALSILLTTAMLLSGIPFSARADEITNEEPAAISAQDAEAVSQDRSESIAASDESINGGEDTKTFLSEEEIFKLRMKQVAEDVYTDSGRYILLPTVVPFSSATVTPFLAVNSLTTTSTPIYSNATVEVLKVQEPWRCRMSEMFGMDMNQVGNQYEAMYSQVVEDSKKINQFIVQFNGTANVSTLKTLTNNAATATNTFFVGTEEYTVVVLDEKVLPDEYMNSVESAVSFIQPDYELELCTIDTSDQESSSTEMAPANQAEDQATYYSSGNIVIALLDTGVDVTHPNLAGHLVDGQNFVGGSAVSATGISFGEAHGTHIAGVIASNASNAKIMPLQVFEQGKAHTSDVIAAIQYAEEHGAQIVNCSWGLDKYNPVLFTTMQNSDMMFVTAAGNNGADIVATPFYPASFDLENVLSVASVNSDGTVSYFSNYGTSVDYAAPGFDIQSTVPGGGYDKMSGTSISAGVVSAALAMSLYNSEPFSASGSIVSAQGFENTWGGNSAQFASLNATDIAASASFAMSLKENGTVWAWGANDYGQCGNDSSNGVPVQIPGLENIKDIAAGWTHGVAVDNDGNLWTWGSNIYGELGDGTTVSRNVPMKLMGVSNVNTIETAGLDNTSVAVKNDGTVLYWGKTGNITTLSPEALELPELSSYYDYQLNQTVQRKIVKVVYAYGGYDDGFWGLDSGGGVWNWKVSQWGGIQSPLLDSSLGYEFNAADIAVGNNFVVVLLKDGTVRAKGQNTYGELGNMSTSPSSSFIQLRYYGSPDFTNIKSISTSCSSIYLINARGEVYCSGDGSFGKDPLGRGLSPERAKSFQCMYGINATEIYGGMGFTVYLQENNIGGEAHSAEYAVGDNSRGYLGVKRDVREEIGTIRVGEDRPVKIMESDTILISNVPAFANPSDVLNSIQDLLPETITVYLEDGVTSFERTFSWDQESEDDLFSYDSTYYCYDVYDGVVWGSYSIGYCTDETPPGVEKTSGWVSFLVLAYPQELVSLQEMTVRVSEGAMEYNLNLPTRVAATFAETGTSSIPVAWKTYSLPYPLSAGTYTLTGNLDVPTGSILMPTSLTPTIKIIVGTQSISEVPDILPIHVPYNCSEQTLMNNLPETVSVKLNTGDQMSVPVEWNVSTFYNKQNDGSQTLTGSLSLPEGVENLSGLVVTIEVIVDNPLYITNGWVSYSFDIPEGTSVEELQSEYLPSTFEANLSNGETISLPIVWDLSSFYPNWSMPQDLHASIVDRPEYILDPIDHFLDISATVTVVETMSTITCTDYIDDIEVDFGTPAEELPLPETVGVVLRSNDRQVLNIIWDTTSYDPNLIGRQTITGSLVLTDDVRNPMGIEAQVAVNVNKLIISSVNEISGISVEKGTPIENWNLPTEVEVVLLNGATWMVPVTWNTTWQNFDMMGTWFVSGEFILPDELQNPNRVEFQIEVTIEPTSISRISEISGITTEKGIPVSDLGLPTEVEVVLSDESTRMLQVGWDTLSYFPDMVGAQIIPGWLCLTYDVQNPLELEPQIEVTVEYPSISSIQEISGVTVEKGTPLTDLDLPDELEVVLPDGTTRMVLVVWDTTNYDPDVEGDQIITGMFVLPDDLRNPLNLAPQIVVTVEKIYVASIGEIGGIEVTKGTPVEELDLPEEVEVDLSDGSHRPVSVTWDTTTYNPDLVGNQTITGTLVLPDDIRNSLGLVPQIEVTVTQPDVEPVDIPEIEWEMVQNIWPTQAGKEHTLAVRDNEPVHTVAFPETVTVLLSGDATAELPVVWKVEDYNPSQSGIQTVYGEVVLPEDGSITNPQNLQPVLKVAVLPREYEVWEAAPLEIETAVLLGTTIDQLTEQLKAEGKAELDIFAFDLEEDEGKYTFCGIELLEEDNAHYKKDISGQYTLTARMEENFIPYDDDMPGPIYVTVTVLPPSEITEVEPARMDAYQSIDPDNLDGIPTQANVTLENGKTVAVDVEWDWREYRTLKDTAGEHIVLGDFVNLPNSVRQPDGTLFKATMIVNTIEVNYTVTDVLSENMFEGDAGLTLAELTEMLKPSLTVEITSVTEEIDIVVEYEVAISFEGECDPEYDSECEDLYIIDAILNLPSNITCPEDSYYNQIFLQTNAVEVLSVEPVYAIATEGTAFEDIQDLPIQVILTLASVDLDGNNKTAIATVDWGDGEGYDPFPTQWDEDGTTVMEVTGYLVDYPQYINGAGVPATLYVTVTQSYDLVAITPNRFPASGAIAVNLGSSLQDIYNQLESHSVQITLQSASGVTSTAEVTFLLREEDNPDYDPMHECVGDESITLKAYLPLDSKINKPEDLDVEIVVALKTYNITNVKPVRIPEAGGQLTTGTAFENLGLPEKAPLVRSDGATDSAPVTWDSSKFDPDKIGSQVVNGTFVTPLPVHLKNPNNRQPKAAVTLVNPTAKILSLQQVEKPVMFSLNGEDDGTLPGFEEYCYLAEILYEDGTTSMELISVFVENMQ